MGTGVCVGTGVAVGAGVELGSGVGVTVGGARVDAVTALLIIARVGEGAGVGTGVSVGAAVGNGAMVGAGVGVGLAQARNRNKVAVAKKNLSKVGASFAARCGACCQASHRPGIPSKEAQICAPISRPTEGNRGKV